jgi:hypothetical protein
VSIRIRPLTSLDADTSDFFEITMRGACRVYRGIPDINRTVTARKRCSNTPFWRLLFEDGIDPTSPKLREKKIVHTRTLFTCVYNDSKKYIWNFLQPQAESGSSSRAGIFAPTQEAKNVCHRLADQDSSLLFLWLKVLHLRTQNRFLYSSYYTLFV